MVVVSKQYCYRPPGSPCSNNTITCPRRQRIYILGDIFASTKPRFEGCRQLQNRNNCDSHCCRSSSEGDSIYTIPLKDALPVYQACSYQQSCHFSFPYIAGTSYDYGELYHGCIPDFEIYNIMKVNRVSSFYWYLYFAGRTSPVKGLTCSCNITSEGQFNVETMYIYLGGKSCNRVKVTTDDKPYYTCNHDGIFYGHNFGLETSKATIEFNKMTAGYDDVIWIGFGGHVVLNAACDCFKSVVEYGAFDGDRNDTITGQNNPQAGLQYEIMLPAIISGVLVSIILVCFITWFIRRKIYMNKPQPTAHFENTTGQGEPTDTVDEDALRYVEFVTKSKQ
ncbi:hypothetical protein SNE40_017287 [Patella caerulea]|uniref:Uncharacterized protein n=1 Tax=Patella caerulea TaxID=87958 RepID=A0AAN8JER9_PATCE